MKKIALVLLCIFSFVFLNASELVYYDALKFQVLGKGSVNTETPYTRFDYSLKDKIRGALWLHSISSAGMAIRFASNSTSIGVKYKSLLGVKMNHMNQTGIRGVDLYCLMDNGEWQFVCSGRPTYNKMNVETKIISNMDKGMREYMLYLSLYDGVDSLYIGIDKGAEIIQPQKPVPTKERPIVMYGTSILQGGCASRPGMAHTNILMRCLNREIFNYGFSGNGKLDLEVARVMSNVKDPGLYVIDCLPNCNIEQLKDSLYNFFKIIRNSHPDVPVLFVGNQIYPNSYFDKNIYNQIKEKNEVLYQLFDEFKKKGNKKIYLMKGEKVIGKEYDATVDGIHLTDLGFRYYANQLYPVIKKIGKFK